MAATVLIVDDHAGFRLTARTLLESEGYEVVGEAETGQQAVRLAAELHPDLVLLDVQLPDIDGFEVAARMLAHANGDGPKIILTSSRDGSDFGPLVGECGARGFVPKAELSGVALARLIR
jgi:DNA-binding NarL/FixJ family response regulator